MILCRVPLADLLALESSAAGVSGAAAIQTIGHEVLPRLPKMFQSGLNLRKKVDLFRYITFIKM